MSSSTVFEQGFGDSRQNPAWQEDVDGALFTVLAKSTDDTVVNWSLIDWLASAETVSSAAYSDSGVTTSSKSVATPVVTFTITGYGETEVTVTSSASRNKTRVFRVYPPQSRSRPRDYP